MLIRLATEEDIHDVFNWRNDPRARDMFICSAPISFSNHERWYMAAIKSSDLMMLIGETDRDKVGVCRFDNLCGTKPIDVSINVNPKMRSQGMGKALLAESVLFLRKRYSTSLSARVKKINTASYRLFSACGFKTVHDDHDLFFMLRDH